MKTQNPSDDQTPAIQNNDPKPISLLSPKTTTTTDSHFHVFSRRAPKRNKKNTHKHQITLEKSQKKFKILIEILNPIPFLPSKTLDFLSHEKLLRCLGLWYFVHIEIGLSVPTFSLSSLPITVPRVVVVMLSLFVLIST